MSRVESVRSFSKSLRLHFVSLRAVVEIPVESIVDSFRSNCDVSTFVTSSTRFDVRPTRSDAFRFDSNAFCFESSCFDSCSVLAHVIAVLFVSDRFIAI